MKKKCVIVLILLLTVGSIKSQDEGNYFHLNIGSGFHNLKYSPENGSQNGLMGFTTDLGYNYFFKPNWGFGIGLGLHNFRSNAKLNYMTETPSVDNNSEQFVYRTYYRDWQEKQKAYFAEMPVGMYYQKRLANEKWKIKTGLGFKVFVPIIAKYETNGGEIETTGYYQQYNEERRNITDENFLSYTSFPSRSIDINPVFALFAEFGFLYALNQKWDLYMGIYGNYAMNNTLESSDRPLYQRDGTYNGILGSNQENIARPGSFGLKIGIRLHGKKAKEEPEEESLEELSTEDTENVEEETVEEEMKPQEEDKSQNDENESVSEEENLEKENDPKSEEENPEKEEKTSLDTENTDNEEDNSVSEDENLVKEEGTPVKEESKVENEGNEPASEEITNKEEQENNKTEPVHEVIIEKENNNENVQFEEEPEEEQGTVQYVQALEVASKTDIKFDYASDESISDDDAKLKSLAGLLNSDPNMKIRIVGHTCDIGSREVNTKIGLERAGTVKKKLLEYGAAENQLITESKAFDEPLVPNTSDENRAKNRRVQIIVEPKNK